MKTLNELVSYLDIFLEKDQFVDSSLNGLQVEGKTNLKKIATAVTADLATIEEAVNQKVDALIVHHGLFWEREFRQSCLVGTRRKKMQLLLENEISLLAYHLPLDAHPHIGNNWKAAQELEWKKLEPFGLYNQKKIGVKGTFEKRSIEVLIAELEAYYQRPATMALGGKTQVSSAALISGGSYKEIHQAIHEGVDCFITGNFDEPAWSIALEEKIHFLALGHTATEKIGPRALAEHLSLVQGIPAIFLETQNPF